MVRLPTLGRRVNRTTLGGDASLLIGCGLGGMEVIRPVTASSDRQKQNRTVEDRGLRRTARARTNLRQPLGSFAGCAERTRCSHHGAVFIAHGLRSPRPCVWRGCVRNAPISAIMVQHLPSAGRADDPRPPALHGNGARLPPMGRSLRIFPSGGGRMTAHLALGGLNGPRAGHPRAAPSGGRPQAIQPTAGSDGRHPPWPSG